MENLKYKTEIVREIKSYGLDYEWKLCRKCIKVFVVGRSKRTMIVISKTPSDVRTMLNIKREIKHAVDRVRCPYHNS